MLPGCSTKALRNGWAAIPLLLVLAGHLAAAAVPPPPGTPQPARFAAGRLIVQLRAQAPGAAVAAAAAAGASSWGQLSAKQHGVALQQAITGAPPPPGSGGTSRRLAAAGTRPGPAVYAITDGSPVLDKVEQLNALPGRGGGEGGGGGGARCFAAAASVASHSHRICKPCVGPESLPIVSHHPAEVAWAAPDYQWHLPEEAAVELPPAWAGSAAAAAGAAAGGGTAPSRRRLAQSGFPDDPEYSKQWHLPSIDAPGAWAQGGSGAGVRTLAGHGQPWLPASPCLTCPPALALSHSVLAHCGCPCSWLLPCAHATTLHWLASWLLLYAPATILHSSLLHSPGLRRSRCA